MKLIIFFSVLTLFCPLFAADDAKAGANPFVGIFFPPELVLLARDRIALTPEQLKTVRARVEKTQPHYDELRAKLEGETAALVTMAKQERVEEAAILAQFDKVLDLEREVKHLQVGMAVVIKNLLTPEQQARLREIAKDGVAQFGDEVRKRLSEKADRVQVGAKKWQENGRDPSPIVEAMNEKVKPLVEAGKAIEAEAELDRLLEQLAPEAK